jgi:hypothetical protein
LVFSEVRIAPVLRGKVSYLQIKGRGESLHKNTMMPPASIIAVVSAVDLLLRPSASWVDRLRYGVRCGIVRPPNMTMGQYHRTPL